MPAEVEAELLEGLAAGRVEQVGIARIVPASREGHVTGPRVARMLRTPDEKHLGLPTGRAEDRGHRRLTRVLGATEQRRGLPSEPVGDVLEPDAGHAARVVPGGGSVNGGMAPSGTGC